ncbi:MAG: hypothetical protein ABL933_16505 [Methyloglobulus sp.]|nr:hypothetical protein [Methyloglobulus sp.]
MSAVLESINTLSALSLAEFIQQRCDLPTEELAKLRERLEIDRLQIDTLSRDSYNEIHRKAFARYHNELQRQAVSMVNLPAED